MAGLEVRSRGAILTGQGGAVVTRVFRSWLQGSLRFARDYARSIAPVLTGRYRRSLIFRTRITRAGELSGELYSTDTPGKVAVIEEGHPPRGPKGKGRAGVHVFRRTEQATRGLFRTQARALEIELARELTK